jgi:hypothetical protein
MENTSIQAINDLKPRTIWEIEEFYICPIIGFCLTTNELRHLMKKCTRGTEAAQRKLTGIELHEFFVMGSSQDNSIARKVQYFLVRKYAAEQLHFRDVGYHEWLNLADTYCNPDMYGAYIWVSATCFRGTKEQANQIYGKIHMYSHEMLNRLRKSNLCIRELTNENQSLITKITDLKIKHKWAEKEIIRLNEDCARLEIEKKTQSKNNLFSEINKTDFFSLRESKESLERLLTEQQSINKGLRQKVISLEEQLSASEQAFRSIKDDIAGLFDSFNSQETRCQSCEKVSLCRKRVLVVGGLARMVSFYREVVEKLDGQFDFHDGRCHNGNDALKHQILQSDLVICPIDINSHAACLEVKRVCKNSRKEFFMLRKSSVSTVYTALVTAANSACLC